MLHTPPKHEKGDSWPVQFYNVTLEEQVRWQGLKDQVKTVLKYNCESDQSSFHSNLKPSLPTTSRSNTRTRDLRLLKAVIQPV